MLYNEVNFISMNIHADFMFLMSLEMCKGIFLYSKSNNIHAFHRCTYSNINSSILKGIVLIQINYANDLIKNAYELNFVYIYNICFIHKNIFICLYYIFLD